MKAKSIKGDSKGEEYQFKVPMTIKSKEDFNKLKLLLKDFNNWRISYNLDALQDHLKVKEDFNKRDVKSDDNPKENVCDDDNGDEDEKDKTNSSFEAVLNKNYDQDTESEDSNIFANVLKVHSDKIPLNDESSLVNVSEK